MTRWSTGILSGCLSVAVIFTAGACAMAQEGQPAAASAPSTAPQATSVALPVPSSPSAKGKKEYTGPTTVVVLPAMPMLDEDGQQRQDPDGKLMFKLPVMQQRDKRGHPLFNEEGKPVMQTKDNLGFDEKGKKLHAVKEKPAKMVSVSISRGTLTVDGMTGKAALNYEIKDLKYIYFYVPWIGTTVVSNEPFPGATEQKKAFDDRILTVTVGEHILQLTSEERLLSKKPESAFVLVDKSFAVPSKFPVMGYGALRVAPYAWPGSKGNEVSEGAAAAAAPPLPATLRPAMLLEACPPGQMRMGGKPGVLGQKCVPIALKAAAGGVK